MELFYKLSQAVAARTDLTGNDKVLLAVIADKIGDNGECWPGAGKLAKATGTNRQTVFDGIKRLKDAGLLAVRPGGKGRSNRYRLTRRDNRLVEKPDQSEIPTPPGRENRPEPVGNPDPNQTKEPDQGNQTHNTPADDAPAGFARFWSAWPSHPRKKSKDKCLARWHQDRLEAKADHVLAVLAAEKETDQWSKEAGRFIPAPLTWLNQQRWDADLADIAGEQGRGGDYAGWTRT